MIHFLGEFLLCVQYLFRTIKRRKRRKGNGENGRWSLIDGNLCALDPIQSEPAF